MIEAAEPLVSVLCPCFNSAAYVERMLHSILEQTYANVELICIDDGSTDRTAELINSYISIFQRRGKSLICLQCEHKGQAAAVNAGLKMMRGEYFCLVDSDDFLVESSIEKRVGILEKNKDYSIAVSDYYKVYEEDIHTVVGKGNEWYGDLCFQPYQFFLLLCGYSAVVPIGYMIRTKDMKKINPPMEINECVEGQNYQILLPMYYYYRRIYIDEPLGYYVIRKDSHDHVKRTREEQKTRYCNLIRMLREVLEGLGLPPWKAEQYIRMSVFYKSLEEC